MRKKPQRPDETPSWVTRLISDAGASAYQWADRDLLALIDPDGRGVAASRKFTAITFCGLGAFIAAMAFSTNLVAGITALVLISGGLVITRAQSWPNAAFLVAIPMMWPIQGQWAAAAAAAGLIVLIVMRALGHHLFPLASLTTTLAVTLLAGTESRSWTPMVLLGIPVAIVVATALSRGSRGSYSRVPFSTLPPAKLSVPLSIRLRNRKELRGIPSEIQRKRVGADGERSTALRLLGLPGRTRFGFTTRARALAFHDIASLNPAKTQANVDHLVLTSNGVYVLDTKVFASRSAVTVDAESHDVVLRGPTGAASIMKLVHSLAIECSAARTALNHPVVPILVIHGASVAEPLAIHIESCQVTVEIIHQRDLIARLDSTGRKSLPRRDYLSLAHSLRAIPSATGGPSKPVKPLPVTYKTRRRFNPPSAPTLTIRDGIRPGEAAAAAVPEQIDAALMTQWQLMEATPPAPLDLVPGEMQRIERGTPFEAFSIGKDLEHTAMRAVSKPGIANGRVFIWATDLPNWDALTRSNKPVHITRIPLDRIILSPRQ